jgi:hypothetical protein
MTAALRAWSPWSPADALRWLVVGLVGHAIAVAAWFLAANEDTLDGQVPWASLAVAGFAVAAYADITWLLQARFAILQRRAGLLPNDLPRAAAPTGADVLVAGPGLARFHRASCPLAAGRDWPGIDRHDAIAEGRQPCGVCAP